MTKKRIAIVGGAVIALAAGSAGAIAATNSDEAKQREQTVLDTAAKKLDVTPQQLRDALEAGRAAEIDQAVKDGKLTQAQADAIKKRIQSSGLVLGGPGGRGPGGPHDGPGGRGGHGPFGDVGEAVAKALGLTEAQLHTQLESGKTLSEIAKAQNKDLADVKAAAKKTITAELDAKVKAGDLTDAQRDELVSRLDDVLDHVGEGPHGRRGPWGPPPVAGQTPPRKEGETTQDGSYTPPATGATTTA